METLQGIRKVHFSLGPVQGFVAAARRTRDLWVGSYLLSYLTGCAMDFILQHGGTIVFPYVHEPVDGATPAREPMPVDPLLAGINAVRKYGSLPDGMEPPLVGSLPNRFAANLPVDVDPARVAAAIHDRWRTIAEKVFERYIKRAFSDPERLQGVRQIWDRQIEHFWEVTWVEESAPGRPVLDLKKNWRTHVPTIEPSDKCTMMTNLQELSGYVGAVGRDQREKQAEFWKALREQGGIDALDLEDDERLSAVALVKRLFPHVAKEAVGWHVQIRYPSTVDLAARPWVDKVLADQTFRAKTEAFALSASRIPFVGRDFERLDGNVFYTDFLANDLIWPENTKNTRSELRQELELFYDHFGEPSPYYAVLLMDGDSMGALLEALGSEGVSRALADFTRAVRRIVDKNKGRLVYAGGDDVLAFIPLPQALRTAAELREAYLESMRKQFPEQQAANGASMPGAAPRPSISAAIVYAHCKAPLRHVLSEAHRLLDEKAKDGVGRDALAVGVWQTHGMTRCWAAPWDVPVPTAEGYDKSSRSGIAGNPTRNVVAIVESLVEEQKSGRPDVVRFSNRFFYRLRELLDMYNGKLPPGSQHAAESPLVPLLVAEYLATREDARDRKGQGNQNQGGHDLERIESKVRDLLLLTQRFGRTVETAPHRPLPDLTAEGPLVVRFLVREEVS